MTPKEKAKELFDKYNYFLPDAIEINKEHLKYCSLIAVDEILNATNSIYVFNSLNEYWKEVKKEIEKI